MKTELRIWLQVPALIIVLGSFQIEAQDFTYTNDNGTITITGYMGPGGDVIIPSMIDGLPVVTIGTNAFWGSGVTRVAIASTVTTIRDYAFENCPNLISLTMTDSVTNIGYAAFAACTSLTNVAIPNSITAVGGSMFSGCTSLMTIEIPNTITSIGIYAFYRCTGLTNIAIPSGVTNIGIYAFSGCASLPGVVIPNTVTTIGHAAFCGCTALLNLTIPGSVASLGSEMFESCSSLKTITVDSLNPFYSSVDGVLFDKGQTTLLQYPGGKAGNYSVPIGVANIGENAFATSSNLTAVTIPGSVTSIGGYAFYNCIGLINVAIAAGVTNIGTSAFSGCTSLKAVEIPSLTSIADFTFYNCLSLTNIAIPSSITSIGDSAFFSCSALTNVVIPNSVTSIASYAFYSSSNLTSVTISASVTNLGSGAFGACDNLAAIIVDPGNQTFVGVAGVLFDRGQTTLIQYPAGNVAVSYTIPDTVTNIGTYAFYSCASLTSVTIPNSVKGIADFAFQYCSRLTNVTIGSGLTSIGMLGFGWCTNLLSTYFEDNAPAADSYVFNGDNGATVYYLPGTTGWGATFGGRSTAVWQPQIRTADPSFGVRSNFFAFNINWATGMSIVVEASANLLNPNWVPLATNTLTGDSLYFSDPQWTNYPCRFYRVRWP